MKKCTHVKIILKIVIQKKNKNKKNKHTPSGYSIFTSSSFDPTKNKFDCYKGEDCIESFCKDLREHAVKTINYAKKKK